MRNVLCFVLVVLAAACAPSGPAAVRSASAAMTAAIEAPRTSPSVSPQPSPITTSPPFSTRLGGPIQRLDANVGFVTTETGLIGTTDGGVSWVALVRLDGAYFSELRFVDAVHGWAIAQRWALNTICVTPKTAPPCWTLMTTSDGGRSWEDVLSVPGNQLGTAPMTSLQAIDDQQAWVVVQTAACAVEGCIGELRATRDGGRTWSVQLSRAGGLGPLRFASASRGWIAASRPGDQNGAADVLGSSDGGVTWSTVYRSTTSVTAIDAASDREAWILTRDGGYCTSSNCARYELLHTSDGGASWASFGNPKEQATCSGGHLRDPLFASPLLGWIGISIGPGGANVGDGGLMRTLDGGHTWVCHAAPPNVSSVSAADPKRIWLRSDPAVSSAKGSTPTLMASDDGGDTWRAVPILLRSAVPSPRPRLGPVRMATLTFTDPRHGWLLRRGQPELDRTADGGDSWLPVGYPPGVRLTAIGFVDERNGFASGWLVNDPQGCNATSASARCRSRLYRSVDGGASWTPVLDSAYLGPLSIVDARNVFAVVAVPDCSGFTDSCGSDLWRTADGGITWSVAYRSATPIWGINFADVHEGYLTRLTSFGLAGTAAILHTVDGGTTWSDELVLQGQRIPAVELSGGEVWAMSLADGMCSMGGCGGYEIRKRTAAGTWDVITTDPVWYAHPTPDYPCFLGGPLFTDADNGWMSCGAGAGASNGAVLHTVDGGRTWSRSTVTTPPSWSVGPLTPLDGDTAIAIVVDIGAPAYLAKTTDGGRTWRRLSVAP